MKSVIKLIPFDIEKARNGAKVVTRDKHDVSIATFDANDDLYPIVAYIKPKFYTDEVVTKELYTKKGTFFSDSTNHPLDLFIEVKELVEKENEKMKEIDITKEHKQYLEYIGLSSSNDVRTKNAGKSDYSKQVIQPWTIWHAYPNITTIDKDIIKRVLRTKEEGNLSPINSRILDYEKIIHDCKERIRQLKVLLETSLPFNKFKTEDDELINKQLEYYELNSK